MLRALEVFTGSALLILSSPVWMFVVRVLVYCVCCLSHSGFCTTHPTPQFSRYLGLQYSYCSYSQHAQCLGHHILEYCNTPRTSSIQSIEPRNAASTASLRKKISNTMHTNMYHAAASCTDTTTYSSINSTLWGTAVYCIPTGEILRVLIV